MLDFTFKYTPTVIFGKNALLELKNKLNEYKVRNLLLVYGKSSIKDLGIYSHIVEVCKELNINLYFEKDVRPNPEINSIRNGVKTCKENKIDFILAAGGGSVIDAAKGIAAATFIKEDAWDIYEGEVSINKALPIGVILTLAATGSENNKNTVVTNDELKLKKGAGSPLLVPKFAIINPEFTYSVNRHHTIAGSLDILAHIFEQYFSPTSGTSTIDYISIGLMKSVIENTNICLSNPNDYDARANILWASSLSLNGLLSTGRATDWTCHSLSNPITSHFGVTHGMALGMLFPKWMEVCLNKSQVMRHRLEVVGKELNNLTTAEETINYFENLFYSNWQVEQYLNNYNEDLYNKLVEDASKDGNLGRIVTIDKNLIKIIYSKCLNRS